MDRSLKLQLHGKILDQLEFQTYQSPVALLSELVANAWDADATRVSIILPDSNDPSSEIVIEDNGRGMTFNDCQEKYLNIGYDTRYGDPMTKTPGGRNIMKRKGIGKFAGFGLASKISVETVSSENGEKTVFEMDIDKLRSDEYVKENGEIKASTTGPGDYEREQGTRIVLKELKLGRAISKSSFPKNLARRFLVHQTSDNFQIHVNGNPIPKTEDLSTVEFTFPGHYKDDEKPDGLKIVDDGWGEEELPSGSKIRWKFYFNKDTIGDEDLQGITISANGKLIQKPFFFNPSRGLGAGQSYMFGQVVADYIDQLTIDPISTDRQRINWELAETAQLLEWGQKRVKRLLVHWHDARGENRRRLLKKKVPGFASKFEKLGKHEQRTVTTVLKKLGGIPSISQAKYEGMAASIITACESGRLHDLWTEIENADQLGESELLKILMETEIIAALNVAEDIRTKLSAISELKSMIERKDLENAVRDHLAKNPWIISPEWNTFSVERKVTTLIKDSARDAGLLGDDYRGRVDLVLSSGKQLLVLEFMRPGLKLDWDHLSRCKRYIQTIRSKIDAQTGFELSDASGYIVADKLARDPAICKEIKEMEESDIFVNDWKGILDNAKSSWHDYLHILVKHGRGDSRLENLLDD